MLSRTLQADTAEWKDQRTVYIMARLTQGERETTIENALECLIEMMDYAEFVAFDSVLTRGHALQQVVRRRASHIAGRMSSIATPGSGQTESDWRAEANRIKYTRSLDDRRSKKRSESERTGEDGREVDPEARSTRRLTRTSSLSLQEEDPEVELETAGLHSQSSSCMRLGRERDLSCLEEEPRGFDPEKSGDAPAISDDTKEHQRLLHEDSHLGLRDNFWGLEPLCVSELAMSL